MGSHEQPVLRCQTGGHGEESREEQYSPVLGRVGGGPVCLARFCILDHLCQVVMRSGLRVVGEKYQPPKPPYPLTVVRPRRGDLGSVMGFCTRCPLSKKPTF